jgi:transposase
MACAASTRSPSSAAAKASPRVSTNSWSTEFLEAGKRRLAGDTARAATSDEVKDLKRQAQELKEVVAEQALELRLLKKSMIADGGDEA